METTENIPSGEQLDKGATRDIFNRREETIKDENYCGLGERNGTREEHDTSWIFKIGDDDVIVLKHEWNEVYEVGDDPEKKRVKQTMYEPVMLARNGRGEYILPRDLAPQIELLIETNSQPEVVAECIKMIREVYDFGKAEDDGIYDADGGVEGWIGERAKAEYLKNQKHPEKLTTAIATIIKALIGDKTIDSYKDWIRSDMHRGNYYFYTKWGGPTGVRDAKYFAMALSGGDVDDIQKYWNEYQAKKEKSV